MRCYAGGNHSGRESKRKESSLLVALVKSGVKGKVRPHSGKVRGLVVEPLL